MKRLYTIIAAMVVAALMSTSITSIPVCAYDWDDSYWDNDWEDDDWEDDDLEDEDDYVEIYDKNFKLYVGDKKAIDYDYMSLLNLTWTSSNPSVATVNQKGKVTAHKSGKAVITAACGSHKDSVTVTVKKNANYKTIAKKMKKYAKKHKGFQFKSVDAGKKCRLYARNLVGSDDSKVNTEGYGFVAEYRSYLELTKKKGRTHLKLILFGNVTELSIYDIYLYPDVLRLSTPNRKLNYNLETISTSDKVYTSGVYEAKCKSRAIVSSDTKMNMTKLKKYKKMLGQKSFKVKFTYSDGASVRMSIHKKIRKNWLKLVGYYQKLLKEF